LLLLGNHWLLLLLLLLVMAVLVGPSWLLLLPVQPAPQAGPARQQTDTTGSRKSGKFKQV
jgi:hypothetical protein